MKKILILLLISVFTIQYGNAQNYKNDGKPYDFFCQLLGYENLSGQLRLKILWNNEKEENNLRDEKGNKIEFQTMTDAMNYMSKHGWEYVECVNYEKVCHYIFKKKVTSDKEAKEGLYFQNDFNK